MIDEDPFSPEAYRAAAERVMSLREQAAAGGLRFNAYLPPDLAVWLIDKIAAGAFVDPSEAIFVMLGEQRDIEPHSDLRQEAMRRSLRAAEDDPRPRLSMEEFKRKLEERFAVPRSEPAVWKGPVR